MANSSPTIHPWNSELWAQLTVDGEADQRRNHALLFSGHTGLGKLDLAFAYAQHLITHNHQQSAALFSAGSHPDMHLLMPEIEVQSLPEGNLMALFAARYIEPNSGKAKRVLSIEQVRRLSEALTTHPHIAQHRVILISHAETLNRNAANALLKSLEEPPAKTVFILVSDEISKLPKTIRSRCSIVSFRAPTQALASEWLAAQNKLPAHEIEPHLAMANNQPLHALRLFDDSYVETLKVVFNDVNGLWNRRRQVVEAAKNWQDVGGIRSVEILQKLCADLLRYRLSKQPADIFFPVQQNWVETTAPKLSLPELLSTIDALAEARRLLGTTVDELLVLETVSHKVSQMPT